MVDLLTNNRLPNNTRHRLRPHDQFDDVGYTSADDYDNANSTTIWNAVPSPTERRQPNSDDEPSSIDTDSVAKLSAAISERTTPLLMTAAESDARTAATGSNVSTPTKVLLSPLSSTVRPPTPQLRSTVVINHLTSPLKDNYKNRIIDAPTSLPPSLISSAPPPSAASVRPFISSSISAQAHWPALEASHRSATAAVPVVTSQVDRVVVADSAASRRTDSTGSNNDAPAPGRGYDVAMTTPDVATGDGGGDYYTFDDDAAFELLSALSENDDKYANERRWLTSFDAADLALSNTSGVDSSEPETNSNNSSTLDASSDLGTGPGRPELLSSSNSHDSHLYAEKLRKIAHIFHYVSIAILGVFVIQVIKHLTLAACVNVNKCSLLVSENAPHRVST